MKITTTHKDKEITYEESMWTGKKNITINGVNCTPIDKKTFKYNDTTFKVTGSFLSGAKIQLDNEPITLVEKPSALEITLSMIVLIFFLVWGNSTTLVNIIPLAGGAIGGAIGGGGFVVNLAIIKEQETTRMKFLMTLAILAACAGINFILTALILGAL